MPPQKTLTIGVLTYNNSPDELKRWHRSFQLAAKAMESAFNIRVLSLDNGERSWLAEQAGIQAIDSIGNVGFARGVNHLMQEAFSNLASDYFITCNPDGFFHPSCLKNLMMCVERNPNAVIEARTFPEEHPKTYNFWSGETNWAVGCCLLIPKNIYLATQGFDPGFFLYLEDVDFSWRCRKLGYRVVYSPNSLYGHGLHGRAEGSTPRRLQLLKAGTYFATKWGFKKELAACQKEIRLTFGESAPSEGFLSPSDGRKLSNGDFFIFSKLRW